jgi:uncharacterized damage-inducible protein DinB
MASPATSQEVKQETKLDEKTALFLRDHYCGEIEREMPTTRKVIAAVPAAQTSYRPDNKSRAAGPLFQHIASSDVIFLNGVADLKFVPGMSAKTIVPSDPAQAAEWYEHHVRGGLARVRNMNADELLTVVDFFGVFQMPAVLLLSFQLKHSIHHRAQLSTYLRPMGAKVPGIYGPSGDSGEEG